MRSRFVAFGLGNFDYIENTQLEPLEAEVRNREAPEWDRLEILSCSDGGPDDDEGTVEFIAYYRFGERRRHRELSRFVKVEGEWRYQNGDITDEAVLDCGHGDLDPNAPCPCGSGRKFKRCCGV